MDLTDDVLIEKRREFLGRRQAIGPAIGSVSLTLFIDDVGTKADALIADVDGRSSDQLTNLSLTLSTERTGELPPLKILARHVYLTF